MPRLPDLRSADDLLAFLRDDLDWPLPDDALLDDLTFDWSDGDLRLGEKAAQKLKGGTVRQLRPLHASQPWGIFLVEFADVQIYRNALRQILRGLVPSRRRLASLRAWQHENLLFICVTADFERITFAHFSGESAGRARLATFGWTRGSHYLRTLLEFNLPALHWPDDAGANSNAWIAQWTRAFDKEAVTRRFFADYSQVFDSVAQDIRAQNARWSPETVERETQTLLNRLLFLCFIQRKGWLNRQRDYLARHLREHLDQQPGKSSYMSQFLRPVFVKLSTKGQQAEIPGHDLPFLNGGLFSDEYGAEQRDDDVRRRHEMTVGNDAFRHVFDELLDAYNFTVREDTPLDVDVAIDPEMLGKIFESLVLQLEQSGTGGKSSRHDTGSHYTPRPFVHYLCRDALAAWLENQPPFAGRPDAHARIASLLALDASDGIDAGTRATLDALVTPEEARTLAERLYELRACDPAVGSGAFPVALLHELLNLARLCETRARGRDPVAADPRWLFDTKTRCIERVLYGVDLQERAIEICKLRLWLSLVVDFPLDVDAATCERHSFQQALRKLPALPNLDFKIRRANSLVDMIRGEPVPLGKLNTDPGSQSRPVLSKLISAKREFFSADSVPEKRRLRFAIYEATAELTQIELTLARNALGLIPDPANADKVAELHHAQKEMGTVLIGIRAARKLKAADQEEALERLRARFDDPEKPTFVWQLDFAEVFHREDTGTFTGGDLLTDKSPDFQPSTLNQPSGFDLMVGNPPYVRIQVLNQIAPAQVAFFKRHYRSASKGSYDLYVVFVERSTQLLAPCGQLAFILPHKFFNTQYGEPLRELLAKNRQVRHVVHFGDQQIFPGATNYVCLLFIAKSGANECRWVRADKLADWLATLRAPEAALPAARLTAAEWNFAGSMADALLDKLRRNGTRLLDLPADMSRGHSTGDDEVFVLEANSREVEKEILRIPVYATDFSRYRYNPNTKWRVIFPYRKAASGFELLPEAELRHEFPKAFRYLSANREKLDQRKGARVWYGFSACRNLALHDKAQILVPLLAESASFAHVSPKQLGKLCPMASGGFTVSAMACPYRIEYLLALLNSRLLFWMLLRTSNVFHGGWITCTKQYFGELPIHPIDLASAPERAEHDALVALVERVLAAKRADPQADTAPLEAEINARVYRLYALTPDEIKLVEERTTR